MIEPSRDCTSAAKYEGLGAPRSETKLPTSHIGLRIESYLREHVKPSSRTRDHGGDDDHWQSLTLIELPRRAFRIALKERSCELN
ncbi:hypothetical protein EVAR_78224_1 [Eumeta japonica]|uniref:Uncharacterized protein n=1 Tax=Eumeta variegata TaxID=151549 RepID=A0A4C1T2U9_EUMVA|nr:hypothetical protein EVAR_78224_1 [Eumeta japonica]